METLKLSNLGHNKHLDDYSSVEVNAVVTVNTIKSQERRNGASNTNSWGQKNKHKKKPNVYFGVFEFIKRGHLVYHFTQYRRTIHSLYTVRTVPLNLCHHQ